MNKNWKKHNRYPSYKISDECEIRNIHREVGELNHIYDRKRNILVANMLNNMGEQETVSLPRLMAETFNGGPHDTWEAIQIDGNIYNLDADNIAWVQNENTTYALYKPIEGVRVVETGEIFESVYECAEKLNITVTAVKRCINNSCLITRNGHHLERIIFDGRKRNV